jgi:hypothetical protein
VPCISLDLEFNVSENVFILWMWLGSASTVDRDAVFGLKEVNQLLNACVQGQIAKVDVFL